MESEQKKRPDENAARLGRRSQSTKSISVKDAQAGRKWFVVDAENQVVGRLASQVAHILRGKNKVTYTPHVDGGDFVVVINADKVRFTGKKEAQKLYYRHTGWMGGIRSMTAAKQRQKDAREIIRHAVAGMMPKNTLGRNMAKKLKVFAGAAHTHAAQRPEALTLS